MSFLYRGSPWTHAICVDCYRRHEPGRQPMRMRPEYVRSEVCCFCGELTGDGIYYRADPMTAICKGEHGQPERPH